MKYLMIFGVLLTNNVWANPNFDTSTSTVTFPCITVDHDKTFYNLQLLLSSDGTWQVLDFDLEPEITQDTTGTRQPSKRAVEPVEGKDKLSADCTSSSMKEPARYRNVQ